MSASGEPYIVNLAVKDVKMIVQPEVNTPESQMRGSSNDPNSMGTLQKELTQLNGQAMADRRYDPAVPSPDGFCNYKRQRQHHNLTLSLVAASLMVALALAMRRRR